MQSPLQNCCRWCYTIAHVISLLVVAVVVVVVAVVVAVVVVVTQSHMWVASHIQTNT